MEHKNNTKLVWKTLQKEKYFCDVVLACEDKEIWTHKVILSSSSPIFKTILKQKENLNPFIYLEDVKFSDLRNLVDFMYQGEVNIPSIDLHSFLKVADDLMIMGLGEGSGINLKILEKQTIKERDLVIENNGDMHKQRNSVIVTSNLFEIDKQCDNRIHENNEPKKLEETNTIDNLITQNFINNTYQTLNESRIRLLEIEENTDNLISQNDSDKNKRNLNESIERLLDIEESTDALITQNNTDNTEQNTSVNIERQLLEIKESQQISTDNHISQNDNSKDNLNESIESQLCENEKQFSCDKCYHVFIYKNSLRRHTDSIHEGVRYHCRVCDLKATDKGYLVKHMKSKHQFNPKGDLTETNTFSCEKCEKQFPYKRSLQRHTESIHEGVCYQCDFCDLKATDKIYLASHVTTVHKKTKQTRHSLKQNKFACNKCEKNYPSKNNLDRHISSIHEGIQYKCDNCSYEANRKGNLTLHIQRVHKKGFRHNCFQCNFRSFYKQSLLKHMKLAHNNTAL